MAWVEVFKDWSIECTKLQTLSYADTIAMLSTHSSTYKNTINELNVIICEKFIIRPILVGFAKPYSAQIVGAIDLYSTITNVCIAWQQPSDIKPYMSYIGIVLSQLNTKAYTQHEKDALMHAIAYLAKMSPRKMYDWLGI